MDRVRENKKNECGEGDGKTPFQSSIIPFFRAHPTTELAAEQGRCEEKMKGNGVR